jgi:phosphatidylserine/phosphatidylglycerophosphate/cardiolipin synthase-like enzyme
METTPHESGDIMSKRKKSGSNTQLSIGGLVLLLLVAAVTYFFNEDAGGGDTAMTPPPSTVQTTTGQPADWYDIYFTDPTCPPQAERTDGLDEIVADDIRQAQVQVDIAAFELNSTPITEALMELEERRIPVRVVIDTDYEDEPEIRRLRNAGISVVTDDRSALMHNKFIVIDGRFTWIGSMNFTTNGAHCNNNNLVRIDSSRLANNYITEMDEMYDDHAFGPRSPENTPNEQLTIEGVRVENYFAPEKEVAPIIGDLVNSAQNEILFMAFSFTIDLVGEPMLDRAENGVAVRGVFETTGSESDFSYYGELRDSGIGNISVRQDGNSRIMHHKVIIIDRETVLFGSFNFSNSANDSNDENIVIIHDPTFTSFFVEEFEVVWGEAKQ